VAALVDACGVKTSDLTADTELGDEGLGLDSITTLELLLAIEAATGRILRSEDLTSKTMNTVGSLTAYVDSLNVE
jgi:acyl carrier protein